MTEQMKPGDAVLVRAVVDRTGYANGPIALVNVLDGEAYSWVSKGELTTEAAIRADKRRRVAEMLGNEAGRLRDRARGIYEGEQVDADAACDEIDRLDIEAETLERMRKRIEREGGAG